MLEHMNHKSNIDIGANLKKIRSEKNYTLAQITSKLGITPSLLSQIENEKITPSLQTLEELLKFYAITLSDFFRQVEQKKYVLVKKEETEILENSENGFKLKLLASKLQNNALESYIVELVPKGKINLARLGKEINGERLIYLMNGSIEVLLDEKEIFILESEDSINFKSYVSCSIKNCSDENSKFLISGMPPILL